MNDNNKDKSANSLLPFLIKVAYIALAITVWVLFQSLIGVPMKMV
ncbi:MAG: hypothetical protein RLZZ66_209 [Pseudomonadota bacterium]|jgi:hypothetical protein